jgi:hypothetical protein
VAGKARTQTWSLAVVERRSVDGVLWVPAPFDNMHNMGILICVARIVAAEAFAVSGWVLGVSGRRCQVRAE